MSAKTIIDPGTVMVITIDTPFANEAVIAIRCQFALTLCTDGWLQCMEWPFEFYVWLDEQHQVKDKDQHIVDASNDEVDHFQLDDDVC